jgi:hypothetical protein
MKLLRTRILHIAGIGLLGVCAYPNQATAQNMVNGSFTLSHEIRWQSATLPAGDYTFSTPSLAGGEPLLVRGPKGASFQLPAVVSHNHSDRPSVLILERLGTTFFVREMDLNEIGLQLSYTVPKFPKTEHELAQGPTSTEQVLIAMAK